MFLESRKFKQEEQSVDLGHQSCTDMKTNRRVIFPPGRNAKEEVLLEVRSEMWRQELEKYIDDNYKLKITTRVNKGELDISLADKGKWIVAMPLSIYQMIVRTHTSKDQEVSWSQIEKAQREIRSNARSLAKIFRLGENKGERNQSRCHDNISS